MRLWVGLLLVFGCLYEALGQMPHAVDLYPVTGDGFPGMTAMSRGEWWLDGLIYKVAVFDEDGDSLYSGADKLVITDKERGNSVNLKLEDGMFNVYRQTFLIRSFKPDGTEIMFTEVKFDPWAWGLFDTIPSFERLTPIETSYSAGFDTKGQKPAHYFVNIWATWCGPCLEKMPKLPELERLNVKVINICGDCDSAAAKEVIDRLQIVGDHYACSLKQLTAMGWNAGFPMSFLFDANGVLEYSAHKQGIHEPDYTIERLKK